MRHYLTNWPRDAARKKLEELQIQLRQEYPAVNAIVSALDSKNSFIQQNRILLAITLLPESSEKELLIPILLDRLQTERNAWILRQIVIALTTFGEAGDDMLISVLENSDLKNTKDSWKWSTVFNYLLITQNERALPVLVRLAKEKRFVIDDDELDLFSHWIDERVITILQNTLNYHKYEYSGIPARKEEIDVVINSIKAQLILRHSGYDTLKIRINTAQNTYLWIPSENNGSYVFSTYIWKWELLFAPLAPMKEEDRMKLDKAFGKYNEPGEYFMAGVKTVGPIWLARVNSTDEANNVDLFFIYQGTNQLFELHTMMKEFAARHLKLPSTSVFHILPINQSRPVLHVSLKPFNQTESEVTILIGKPSEEVGPQNAEKIRTELRLAPTKPNIAQDAAPNRVGAKDGFIDTLTPDLNAIAPTEVLLRIYQTAERSIQTVQQNTAQAGEAIREMMGVSEPINLNAKEAVILGHDLVVEKGMFAVAPELIHAFGGVGAVIQTNSVESPIAQAINANKHAGDQIVIAGNYREAVERLKQLGFTSFHFILSSEDGPRSELRKMGRVTVLSDHQIFGLLAKFETMIQAVRSELRIARAA